MEAVYSQYAWLIPVFPLLAFLLLISLGRQMKTLSAYISVAATLTSFVMAVLVLIERVRNDGVPDYSWSGFEWLSLGGVSLQMGFEVTNLNALMLLVVTLVSLLVNVYSIGYMKEDKRITVFFSYISLFTFAMLGLVIAENILQLYIFWELVGLCSFLLIGFWYYKPEAKAAAKKAFIMTRIGDVGLFIAILLLFWYEPNHALDFTSIHNAVTNGDIPEGIVTFIAILIFIAAIGKSGQFPLHTWLPDAMEGPTPISALIHAATMVAAGVFLVARTYDLFVVSPTALAVVAYIGVFTAIFAATIAITQNDIKRILAYSTISQLGYMMFAMGIGTEYAYAAGLFHLFTHAFFKALLFLGAGSVIHMLSQQNIQLLGGVGRTMKVTMWTFAIGAMALAGIFPFSGFWSKDAILTEAYLQSPLLFWIGLLAGFFTAFYMARLFFLVFTGEPRSAYQAQEAPSVMTVPLIVLAILAVVAGFVFMPHIPWLGEWLTGGTFEQHTNWFVIILSNVVAILGIVVGWAMYGKGAIDPVSIRKRVPKLYDLLQHKYYMDEIYHAVIILPLKALAFLLHMVDTYIVKGIVKLVASIPLSIGRLGLKVQNGQVQTYSLMTLFGFLLFIVIFFGRRFLNIG